jgi:tRNA (guanine37-N1)-methyltransferase
MEGLLDHPHYTRPEFIDGRNVPDVLLSGDHAEIARWRTKQDDEQQSLLDEFLKEQRQ